MSRTFEGDFAHLLKAIREWAKIGNPMPAKNANEKLSWLFQQYGIVPDTPAGREQQRTAQRRLQGDAATTARPSVGTGRQTRRLCARSACGWSGTVRDDRRGRAAGLGTACQ